MNNLNHLQKFEEYSLKIMLVSFLFFTAFSHAAEVTKTPSAKTVTYQLAPIVIVAKRIHSIKN